MGENQSARFVECHFPALLLVTFKKTNLSRGEIAIQHIKIGLVVQTNRAIVEITRPNRDDSGLYGIQRAIAANARKKS
jgi:hypothetical protein